jgi:ribA/ribD-fused uncharacterized protein
MDADKILFFEGRWYMFSNFSAFAVYYDNFLWMTAEHAYQAAKFEDPETRRHIRNAHSAHEAKQLAKVFRHEADKDWPQRKLGVMEEILRAKLTQHDYVARQLWETGDREIVEDSPYDSFWGSGSDGKGENHLGKIWMKLRTEIQINSRV